MDYLEGKKSERGALFVVFNYTFHGYDIINCLISLSFVYIDRNGRSFNNMYTLDVSMFH